MKGVMSSFCLRYEHSWKVTPKEAIEIQQKLRGKITADDRFSSVKTVAGVDVGFEKNNTVTRAAIVVLDLQSLELREHAIARRPTSFPYVPGLLSFREIPAVLDAMRKLKKLPHLLLCDGQGFAHPRRFGIACHLGLLTGIPAVGVAKSLLVGKHGSLLDRRGSWKILVHKDETVGAALRTRPRVKPVYVSVGHRISLESAIDYVMQCTTKYRLPETTRWAHKLASGK